MSESTVRKKRRLARILSALHRTYPEAQCALHHSNPLQLLAATILSAQCTDVRVNQVTPKLFARFRTAQDYARASRPELERIIRSTGFFRNKARSLAGMGNVLLKKFGGRVPDRMEDLLELPGVARKTANVLLGTWFEKAEGVVVDTHVLRIAHRLQLSPHKDPVRMERDLMALLPRKDWISFSHMVIWHGRQVCAARAPQCAVCPLARWCPSAEVTVPRGT